MEIKNFEHTTIDEVKSIFKAGFKEIESRGVSPFQKSNDNILLTRTGDVFRIYLESKNTVRHKKDGSFELTYPFVDECTMDFCYDDKGQIIFLQFNARGKMFNFLGALAKIKEIGLSVSF